MNSDPDLFFASNTMKEIKPVLESRLICGRLRKSEVPAPAKLGRSGYRTKNGSERLRHLTLKFKFLSSETVNFLYNTHLFWIIFIFIDCSKFLLA